MTNHRNGTTSTSAHCVDCVNGDAQMTRHRREHGRTDEFPYVAWGRLLSTTRYRCTRCRRQGPMSIDHVVPVSSGGRLVIENLQPLCVSCNARKGGGRRRTMPRQPQIPVWLVPVGRDEKPAGAWEPTGATATSVTEAASKVRSQRARVLVKGGRPQLVERDGAKTWLVSVYA